VTRSYRPLKILFLAIALAAASLFSGCAHKDNDKPWRRSEHHWWQSDVDSEDRSFFYGSFFN